LIEHLISAYELTKEENQLLQREREFVYEQNIKNLTQENDELRGEVNKARDQMDALKAVE
jgi:hypothetical protein